MGESTPSDLKPIDRSLPLAEQIEAVNVWLERQAVAAAEAERYFRERRESLDESVQLMRDVLVEVKQNLRSTKSVDTARRLSDN